MAPHSSTLAWQIPWMEEPGRLQSMGSLRVGHDWAWTLKSDTSLSLFTFMHWRRKWQPTPVFLPGESQGRGSLVGCHLWGCESWIWLERLSSSSSSRVACRSKVFRNHCTELVHVSMIQTFWSQLTGVFETYDTSQVKDFFENINIY